MVKKTKEEETLNPVAEETTETPAEETTETPVEEKKGKITVKEESLKMFTLIKAPEEVKKIFDFYWVTSKDLFEDKLKEKWLKADEIKTVKQWYATLI